jgi:small-conductance mechanosensitive channel
MKFQTIGRASGQILLAIILVLIVNSNAAAVGSSLSTLVPKEPAEKTAPLIKDPVQPKISVPNLVTYTSKLSEALIDLQSQLSKIKEPEEDQEKLDRVKKSLQNLNWNTKMQQADTNLSYKQLSETLQLINQQQETLASIAEPLKKAAQLLDDQKTYWSKEQETLKTWATTLKHEKSFTGFRSYVKKLQSSITAALASIDDKMEATLTTLHKTSALQVQLYTLKVALDDLLEEIRKVGIEQTSPPLYAAQFYSRIHLSLFGATWQNTITELSKAYRITIDNGRTLLLLLATPILLTIIFIINRDKLKKHANWSMLTDCPLGFSFFTFLIFMVPFIETAMEKMLPIISTGLILSVMRLAGKLEKQSIWVVRFIYALSFFLVLSILVELINLPLPLRRIYDLITCSIWLVYFLLRFYHIRGSEQPYLRVTILFTCLSLMVIIVATFMGYDKLSQYLFKGIFMTIFLFISSIILFNTTSILLELLLTMIPVIRRHAAVIITSLQPFIFCLSAILFYGAVSSVWLIFPTSQDAITALATLGIPLGSYTLTMQSVLVGLGIIYGALLISRAIQTILLDEIMPRNNIDLGVQLSIARLVHYTILLIGFLVLLQVMGVSLTKLTILGGALGVGIGFGLQTIVNNFASGLILLFERPIKVGDTIELGTEMGVVRHLGLRSTIIKTFDNAEIVVPNSDLITAQVTNWTLAERRARVKLPVGVAYGSDIPTVLEILLRVAGEHPMILTTPPPRALFLAFGASSLDFELRVWIADFNNRRQVQSELNQEINSEFADAGIEIPFPQADLHIRTVDEEAAAALHPGKTHCSDKTTPAEDTI